MSDEPDHEGDHPGQRDRLSGSSVAMSGTIAAETRRDTDESGPSIGYLAAFPRLVGLADLVS